MTKCVKDYLQLEGSSENVDEQFLLSLLPDMSDIFMGGKNVKENSIQCNSLFSMRMNHSLQVSATGAGFLRVLWLPLPILIPPTVL
jgi:hypothetical protein